MEAPSSCKNGGDSTGGSWEMAAPRSSGSMTLVGNSSSVGMEAAVTFSSTYINRGRSASISRGQGAFVGLATPEVGGISRNLLRLQERRLHATQSLALPAWPLPALLYQIR